MRWRDLAALLLAALGSAAAHAHKSSDAYLTFAPVAGGTELRWDIALRDLDAALDTLDADGDRGITFGEFKAAVPAIEAHALAHLHVAGCRWTTAGTALESRSDGTYAALRWRAACAVDETTPIGYTLLADVDPTHRGIAKIEDRAGRSHVRLLDPAAPETSDRAAPPSFVAAGVFHILTGYDHLLFLLCLILPAVLRRTPSGWRPVANWRDALLPVAGIVTLFTLAHSITLALAALKLAALPSWFVEPAIAATIALAAVDNLRPVFGRWRGIVTFLFGLIHGFGFAGVLAELDLPAAQFGWALLRFNAGLELGQLAIVAAVVPLLYAARGLPLYRYGVVRGGSLLAIGMAAWWFAERVPLA